MTTMTYLWDLVGPLNEKGEPTGPVKSEINTILAREAMVRDPKRYVQALPKGMSPGPAETERLERIQRLEAELKGDGPDPHFPSYTFGRPPA